MSDFKQDFRCIPPLEIQSWDPLRLEFQTALPPMPSKIQSKKLPRPSEFQDAATL